MSQEPMRNAIDLRGAGCEMAGRPGRSARQAAAPHEARLELASTGGEGKGRLRRCFHLLLDSLQRRLCHGPASGPDAVERTNFSEYFDSILGLDGSGTIYGAIYERFSGPIRVLLDNQYVFQPFWDHHSGLGHENWEFQFAERRKEALKALLDQDTRFILSAVFDRLYVLRNQLIHGGATWNGSVNRDQVRDGARIMAFLVPLFIDRMMDNPGVDWGPPYYPVVD